MWLAEKKLKVNENKVKIKATYKMLLYVVLSIRSTHMHNKRKCDEGKEKSIKSTETRHTFPYITANAIMIIA